MRQVVVPPPAAAPRPDRGAEVRRIGGATMGATWSAAFTHPAVMQATAQAAVQAALDAVVAQMSPWEPASDLNRYNAAPAGAWVELPADLLQVVDAALRVAAETGGAFDPTLGALVDLWGFGAAPFRGGPPTADEIAAAAGASGWRRVERDGSRLRQPGGLRLDLGGIAKGFGVDKAKDALTGLGVTNALVEVGGELKGLGAKPDGSPWWVGVESAPGSKGGETVVALSGWSVATSADHRRAFVHEGVAYGHTLDPATAGPRRSLSVSATVMHAQCMVADAFATAALVMSPDAAIDMANRRGIAMMITCADRAECSRLYADWAA